MKNLLLKTLILVLISLGANASQFTVNTQGMNFVPSSLVINVGDTVIFNNNSGNHNLNGNVTTFPLNPESFGISLGNNWSFTHVFNIPGNYNYQCDPHLPGMVGSIIVNPIPNTVYDIVSNSTNHTILKTAIDTCALDAVLSSSGPYTLFAPTDAAFNNLPAGAVSSLLSNIPQLWDFLLHHVIGDSIVSNVLSNNQVITTLLGTDLNVSIINGQIFIDNSMILISDIVADNGVVHVVDVVLDPNFDCNGVVNGSSMMDSCGVCQQSYIYDYVTHAVTMLNDTFNVTLGPTEMLVMANNPQNPYWNSSCSTNSIYDIVSNSSSHTTLKTAIDACSLDGVLSGPGPFTLFAPTDAAFNNLPAGTLTALLNDIPALTDILKHHVVSDSVTSSMLSNNQIVTTLLGTDITVTINSSGVYIDNAMVTLADLTADNGVVHVIDAVLIPTSTSIIDSRSQSISEYLYSVNILGKRIARNTLNQIIFDVYNDGNIIKRFVR